MATNNTTAQLIPLITNLLFDKKTTASKSLPPGLLDQFNQVFQATLPTAQNGTVTEQELNQLLQSIMT